jgi:hypothetical protein
MIYLMLFNQIVTLLSCPIHQSLISQGRIRPGGALSGVLGGSFGKGCYSDAGCGPWNPETVSSGCLQEDPSTIQVHLPQEGGEVKGLS